MKLNGWGNVLMIFLSFLPVDNPCGLHFIRGPIPQHFKGPSLPWQAKTSFLRWHPLAKKSCTSKAVREVPKLH
jgi:hypothetical protein